jgi:hypothetical protein
MPQLSTFVQASVLVVVPLVAGPTAIENPLEDGRPVLTVKALDSVWSAGLAIAAFTLTVLCAVPELTTVCTVPSAAEVAEAGEIVRPPTVESRLKVTGTPGRAPPVASVTLNVTVDVSASPVPFKPMVAGSADTNCIDPTAAAATVIVPVAVRLLLATTALAVMTSGPLQPFAV